MKQLMHFGEVLEAIDNLSLEEQETVMDILYHRVAERGRRKIAAEVQEARKEFKEKKCQVTTPDELMKEILS